MFEFQILHADSNSRSYDFSTSDYKLKDGELFGYYRTSSDSENGFARLYIGDGKTKLGQLRYIGQDIDDGNIVDSRITGGIISNATLSGGFNCSGATLFDGKLIGFDFEGCHIPTNSTLTNDGTINNAGGTITGGTLSGNAFISENSNTNITGGKIAGFNIAPGNRNYLGTLWGEQNTIRFISSEGVNAWGSDGATKSRFLYCAGRTMIDTEGTLFTTGATIQNSNLTTGNTFPSSIDTNVTSANYLNSNEFSLAPIIGGTFSHKGRINDVETLRNKDTIFYFYSYNPDTRVYESVSPIYIPHKLFDELTMSNHTTVLQTTNGDIEISAIYIVQGGVLLGFDVSINLNVLNSSISPVTGIYTILNN